MRWIFWKKPQEPTPEVIVYTPENPPPFREDKRTYVCHGNNLWGNSITRSKTDLDHVYSVTGWLATAAFPRVGDELLMKMSLGGWGSYVFVGVKLHLEPHDLFSGTVFGAYGLSDREPKTKNCDEFIELKDQSPFFRV